MLMDAYRDEQPGIRIPYRTDGHLLKHRRMPSQTSVSTTTVHDMLFADDCGLNTLGSTLPRNTRINDEVVQRISKASQAFGRLQASMWDHHGINLNTKPNMYTAVVLMTPLNGAETVYSEPSQEA
ncbi:unnamed protein product [Schistocephalus solidus]|uniref:Reverse transcriptase domain-containing protein n=1 Tax=Schistocephalus solidus TaxID=70667 RepID=A0A183TQX7_SCHSO|nr:unnamed protein product [Schistocephalus solidus]